MSTTLGKVKDLIEVREYESLIDFHSEPSKTLANYHFTAVTSELMSKWLDNITGVAAHNGCAMALAGFRGVGKSHFLATIGALLAHPEFRSRVTDSHVATSAQHLLRKQYPIASIKRGTKETLLEEIIFGVSVALDVNISDIPKTPEELIDFLGNKSTEVPFILIVDTAFERDSRVTRDDGVLLGKLAELAKDHNIFIGIALDDDITDADGINSAIARVYTIDYLDQEHLNYIVDTHIFPKHRQTQSQLTETYQHFREVIPGFRWSEQRFTSLYPMHPSILELAPFIRLYSKHFALLGFASQAGVKILGRPANSLIALDEVFDSVETSLRKSEDLEEAFDVYDRIGQEVITKIPVMQRLQAKLILKALFILSLDGDGTTATEISATMMIYDENDSQKAVNNVSELLETVVSIFPNEVQRKAIDGKETRYSLKISSKDQLNDALEEQLGNISESVIPEVLGKVANDAYSDWNLSYDKEHPVFWSDIQVNWRGSNRRCRIYWNWANESIEILQQGENTDFIDFEIFVNNPENSSFENIPKSETPKAIWKPAELNSDEINTILKYSALVDNEELRNEHHDQLRAAGHTHIREIEKAWNRIFLSEAKILFENEEHRFQTAEPATNKLSNLFSPILEVFFDQLYPKHPRFEETLGMNEVSRLVNNLFSGAKKTHGGVQDLAKTYALPLGLVSKKGNEFKVETEDKLFSLPLVEKILSLVNESEDSTVLLKTIYKRLKEKPYGLVREVQHLLLAALVAQSKIEFVTANGDRINRRSLDLKIIWDDIAGIVKPENVVYGSQKLTDWAKTLTNLKEIKSIDLAEDRNAVKDALAKWLSDWDDTKILEEFNKLPDEILNTKIWYISVNIEKSFGSVVNSIRSFLGEIISLEVCLQRVADAFSDSNEEFMQRQNELVTFVSFISSATSRQQIWGYLAICEKTHIQEIEMLRNRLNSLLEESSISPTNELNTELEHVWSKFHKLYSEHFSIKHDTVMKSHQLQENFNVIIKSDQWWEFENLSKLPIFHQKYWRDSQRLIKHFGELDCNFNVREMLVSNPFCACSFNLTQMQDWENLPKSLITIIEKGRTSYRRTLQLLGNTLIKLIENYLKDEKDQGFVESASDLIDKLENNTEMKLISTNQLIILHKVLSTMVSSPSVNIQIPQQKSLINSEELRQNINSWIDELPTEPVFLKL